MLWIIVYSLVKKSVCLMTLWQVINPWLLQETPTVTTGAVKVLPKCQDELPPTTNWSVLRWTWSHRTISSPRRTLKQRMLMIAAWPVALGPAFHWQEVVPVPWLRGALHPRAPAQGQVGAKLSSIHLYCFLPGKLFGILWVFIRIFFAKPIPACVSFHRVQQQSWVTSRHPASATLHCPHTWKGSPQRLWY